MGRLRDWAERLDAVLAERRHQPFEWGVNDCALLAAAAVEAVSGDCPLHGLRWANGRGAARQIAAEGGLRAAVTARLGSEIAPELARAGDIGLVRMPAPGSEQQRDGLAVCGGPHWFAPGPDGLVTLQRAEVLAAWRAC